VLTGFTLSAASMNFNNPPFSSIDKKQLEIKVDAYVKPYLQTGDFSGSILIAKSGDVLLMKSYGPLPDEWSFIYRAYWSSLTFVRDDNGKVTHLLFDSYKGIKEK